VGHVRTGTETGTLALAPPATELLTVAPEEGSDAVPAELAVAPAEKEEELTKTKSSAHW
jgi:hypothetical protein